MPIEYYIQHGKAGEPMRTERLKHKVHPRKSGREQNPKELWLATDVKVRIDDKWRRLYRYNPATIRKGSGYLFVGRDNEGIRVMEFDIDRRVNHRYIDSQLHAAGWYPFASSERPDGGQARIMLQDFDGNPSHWLSVDSLAQIAIADALQAMALRKDKSGD